MLNETKEQAFFRLIENYTDVYGAVTLYDKSQSNPLVGNYDSENQHLFTGEMALLLKLNNLDESIYWEKFVANANRHNESCSVVSDGKKVAGLYFRHPPIHYRNHPDFHGFSHDEMSGVLYLSIATNNRRLATDLLTYGRNHNYGYIEEEPYVNPIPKYVNRIRQPKDRAWLKLAAGEYPGTFEHIQFMFNLALSSTRTREETSGRLMSFFKIKSLELMGYDDTFFRLVKWLFKYRNKKQYGVDYMEEIAKIYFKDVRHPTHTLIRGLSED